MTAAYGTQGVTGDHWEAFERYATERILIAYDRDEAGEHAAEKLAKQLAERGIGAYRIQFPKGMDANEYARKVQPAAQALSLVIRKALWVGQEGLPNGRGVEPTSAAVPASAAVPTPSGVSEAAKGKMIGPELADRVAEVATASPPCVEAPAPVLPLAASPEPAPPVEPPEAEAHGEEVVMTIGDRRWRIRGIAKNTSFDALRVNVLVARDGAGFHVDTLDLYSARHRRAYLQEAAAELALEERIVKKDLGQVLLRLEALQEEEIQRALSPSEKTIEPRRRGAGGGARAASRSNLLTRILTDFERCGLVGEETASWSAISRRCRGSSKSPSPS